MYKGFLPILFVGPMAAFVLVFFCVLFLATVDDSSVGLDGSLNVGSISKRLESRIIS